VSIVRYALLVTVAIVSVWAFVPQAIRAQAPPAPVVDAVHFAYSPASLTVAAGSTVVFKNLDSTAHTVTATDKSFDSGEMTEGASWSHVFAKPGTYTYLCTYHTYMEGTIVVK
jgi:plastocyanin